MVVSLLKSIARVPLTIIGLWLIVWISNVGLFISQLKSFIIDFLFSWLGGLIIELARFVDSLITCGLVLAAVGVPIAMLLYALRALFKKETILDVIICIVLFAAFFVVCDWRLFEYLPAGIQEFVAYARDTLHFELACATVDEELHVNMFVISLLVGIGGYIYYSRKESRETEEKS